MKLLKVPKIIVRGEELVARGPSAREHQPAARTTAAPAHLDRTEGAPVAPGSSSACSRWRSVDVDRHSCASKQVWIVRFARREQGWGRVRRRCKSSSWRKVRGGVRGRTAPGRRTVKLSYFASSCAKVATENSTSGSSLGTFSSSQRRSRGRHGSCT